jgi:hypothetical protein
MDKKLVGYRSSTYRSAGRRRRRCELRRPQSHGVVAQCGASPHRADDQPPERVICPAIDPAWGSVRLVAASLRLRFGRAVLCC